MTKQCICGRSKSYPYCDDSHKIKLKRPEEIKFEIIYPKVYIYRNLFKDIDGFLDIAKKQEKEKWEKWYTFGSMLPLMEQRVSFDKFPTIEEYREKRAWGPLSSQSALTEEVGEIFYKVTKHYLDNNPDVALPNYSKGSASINIYQNDAGISEHYAMNYHTDFVVPLKENPGTKFGITTTFYLNDDYEGGEICFKINDHYISHKPQAGDVIVFPSMDPYMHGVRKSFGTERYMIRCFWEFEDPGSPEWHANKEKYGEEVWEQMEKERHKKEIFSAQIDGESIHEFFGRDNGKYK
jgi:hypothetical protein